MDVRSPFVAHPQSAELPEPGQRPLNDPPVHAQPAAMLLHPVGRSPARCGAHAAPSGTPSSHRHGLHTAVRVCDADDRVCL